MEMSGGSAYAGNIFIHAGLADDWHGLQTRCSLRSGSQPDVIDIHKCLKFAFERFPPHSKRNTKSTCGIQFRREAEEGRMSPACC